MRIPCLVNGKAGSAKAVLAALAGQEHLDIRPVEPGDLRDALQDLVAAGASRIAVAGGDGTLRTAAAVLAGTPTELGVIPGGTLNHFAKHHDIPLEPAEAAGVVRDGAAVSVDVGYVNDRLILNTSSVGVYVLFVRTRERFERYMGYRVASVLAAIRILWRLRTYRVELEVDGETRRYETPLVFVGIGERVMKLPSFGDRDEDGRRGLHVVVVRRKSRARLVVLGITAAARGIPTTTRTGWIDSMIVDECRIEFPRPHGNVAVDGEIHPMVAPLDYRIARSTLRVVVPAARQGADGSGVERT